MRQIDKSQVNKELETHDLCDYKPTYKENPDLDLKEVIDAWPELSEYIKTAIQALVQTKITKRQETQPSNAPESSATGYYREQANGRFT